MIYNFSVSSSVTVSSTTKTKLLEQPSQGFELVALCIRVTGSTEVSLGDGIAPVAGEGLLIKAGQRFIDSATENYLPTQNTIWGLASSANSTVAIYARYRKKRC